MGTAHPAGSCTRWFPGREPRHLHVEQEQMHFVPANDTQRFFAVARLQGLEPAVGQHAGDRLAKIAIVVGDQEAWSDESGMAEVAAFAGRGPLPNATGGCRLESTGCRDRSQTVVAGCTSIKRREYRESQMSGGVHQACQTEQQAQSLCSIPDNAARSWMTSRPAFGLGGVAPFHAGCSGRRSMGDAGNLEQDPDAYRRLPKTCSFMASLPGEIDRGQ